MVKQIIIGRKKSKKGFASMSPEKQREIARKGGAAVPAEKRSFSKNAELASAAGKIGGASVPPERRMWAKDVKLAKEAGRKGGLATVNRRQEAAE